MSSMRRKLRQKKDRELKRRQGARVDDFDEEGFEKDDSSDEDLESSDEESGSRAGTSGGPGADEPLLLPPSSRDGKEGREQQDWYNTSGRLAGDDDDGGGGGGSRRRRSADDAAGGGGGGDGSEAETKAEEEEEEEQSMASLGASPQATPFFRVRRRTYKSRTIIGRARGFMKDRTDDLKEYANAWIIDQQYGPPYLLEKNRDFYKEACKMNPSFGIIHDHLKAKTNPNYTGPRQKKGPERGAGFTATHYSALYANATMLAMLLRARAELNIQAKCGRTPLLIACAGTYPDHEKVARMLLRHGADPNIRDKGGNSALSLAIRRCDLRLVRLLIKHHVDVNREPELLSADQGVTDVDLAKKMNEAAEAELKAQRKFLTLPERILSDLMPTDASKILQIVGAEAAKQARIRKIVYTATQPRFFNHRKKRADLRQQHAEKREETVRDNWRREIERQMDKRDEVMESEKRRNSKKPAGRYLRVAPSRWELQVPKTLTTTGSIKPLKPAKKVRKKRISPAEWGEAMVFEDEIRNSVREAHREQLTGALEVIELDP